MGAQIVVFIEDSRWVGLWPSHVDGLRQLVAATGGGTLAAIDSTEDGWFSNGTEGVVRHPRSVYDKGRISDLAEGKLVAVETTTVDFGVEPSPLSEFSHPAAATYVFGDHNGLDPKLVSPDAHVYVDLDLPVDVRDVITLVLGDRCRQFRAGD